MFFHQMKYPVSEKDMFLADAHNIHGNNYMRRNFATSAEFQYTLAIKLNKWNSIYYCNRAFARFEQRRFVFAIADCKRALALNPDYAEAYARMGLALSLTTWPNRYEEAVQCFRKALRLNPGNERYKRHLRIAEKQVNSKTSGSPHKTTGITSTSVLGIRPQISGITSTSSTANFETSRPISNTAPHTTKNAQISQTFLIVGKDKPTNKNSITTSKNRTSNIGLPTSANKEAKQQPEFKTKHEPSEKKDATNYLNTSEERVINTSLSTHSFVSKSQPYYSYTDGSGSSLKVMDAKTDKKLQTSVPVLPQREMEAKSINLEDIPMPSLEDFGDGVKGLQDYCEKLRSLVEQQSNNLVGKGITQACVNDVKNKTKYAKKGRENSTTHMPPLPERFVKFCGASLQGFDKRLSSLIRPKNSSRSKTNYTRAQEDKLKGKTTGNINKDVENVTKHAEKGKEITSRMPLSENLKKLWGASLQGHDKLSLSLIRPKSNRHSIKTSTGNQADKVKEKTTRTIKKDVKKVKTAPSPGKDLSRNKQENRENKSLNINNSETSCAEKSQNNSNETEYYFTVVPVYAFILCSALFYFKRLLQ